MHPWLTVLIVVVTPLAAIAIWDITQRRHAILRTFPVLGHFRYILEKVGPELRQYIVTSNEDERPFNRNQRRWIYSSSKLENRYFGFGTDRDLERSANTILVGHSTFPEPAPVEGKRSRFPDARCSCPR